MARMGSGENSPQLPASPDPASAPRRTFEPRVDALVNDLIGRVADKWTLLVLNALAKNGELRFTRLAAVVNGVSQKMLTQTLRHMERDGLVKRTVHPVVPPKVEYRLTRLGLTLGKSFCGVWAWAQQNVDEVEAARREFASREPTNGGR